MIIQLIGTIIMAVIMWYALKILLPTDAELVKRNRRKYDL